MFRKDITQGFVHNFQKNLFENVKFFFDLICEIFNIQKAPSKITENGVKLQRENVFAVSHVGRKPENDPNTKMKRGIFHNHQKTHPKYQKQQRGHPQDSGTLFPLQKTSKTKI